MLSGHVFLDGEMRFCEGETIKFSAHSMNHHETHPEPRNGYIGYSGQEHRIVVRLDGVMVHRANVEHLHDMGADKAAMAMVLRRCRNYLPDVLGREIRHGEACPACGRSADKVERVQHAETCEGARLYEDIKTTLRRVGAAL